MKRWVTDIAGGVGRGGAVVVEGGGVETFAGVGATEADEGGGVNTFAGGGGAVEDDGLDGAGASALR